MFAGSPLSRREVVEAKMVNDMNQTEQRGVGDRFIPVIENGVERPLALHGADDDAENNRHPQQRGEAAGEADAAEAGEADENCHSQRKPNEDLRRSQCLRGMRKLHRWKLGLAQPRRSAPLASTRDRFDFRPFAGLREIIAAKRFIESARFALNDGDAGSGRRGADALDIDKRAQDGQRQVRMMGFDRLIEPFRKLALTGQRAMPFAFVINDTAKLPLRQFQIY
jgi:hypothetical protein